MNNDEVTWYESFLDQKNKNKGLYEKIGHMRWKEAIEIVTKNISEGVILKTDSWNEAMGSEYNLINNLVERGNDVLIMDISLDILRSIDNHKCKINADINDLPIKSNSIDCILDISTSDHCSFEKFNEILLEYSRILKYDGLLLLIHNSNDSIPWKIMQKIGYVSPAYSGTPPAYFFSGSEVIDCLEKNGFDINNRYHTNLFGWAKPLINILPHSFELFIKWVALSELNSKGSFLYLIARQHVIMAKLS